MSKSVYSIVLSDGVVELIDAMATRKGMSRSTTINNILADHLSMVTPEKRVQEILAQAERLLDDSTFQMLPTLADGLLAVRAPVRFKYNPTVRCVVELCPAPSGMQGELRAAARTQSVQLIEALNEFFVMFAHYSGFASTACHVEGGRFTLGFLLPVADGDEAAAYIADLLQTMQRAMQGFFAAHPDRATCAAAVREICTNG
ncbi:MAG: hypothetical protein RR135_03155 [Oscillospiraceae bacterium]